MSASHSDAYYLAKLFDRLQHLETELSSKISPNAELTVRSQILLKDLAHLLRQGDEQALDILEYSFIPRINKLLLDARHQLKLKNPVKFIGGAMDKKAQQRNKLEKPRLEYKPVTPKIVPRELSEPDRQILIEDALSRLKMLLSQA